MHLNFSLPLNSELNIINKTSVNMVKTPFLGLHFHFADCFHFLVSLPDNEIR